MDSMPREFHPVDNRPLTKFADPAVSEMKTKPIVPMMLTHVFVVFKRRRSTTKVLDIYYVSRRRVLHCVTGQRTAFHILLLWRRGR